MKAKWGEMTVDHGLVRMNDWSAYIVLAPDEIVEGVEAKGEGYILKLNEGWAIGVNGPTWHIYKKE